MNKLTKRYIDSMKFEAVAGRRDVRWDSALPGFGVRVYPSGRKTFVVFYRVNGRQRLMSLGHYGTVTLDEARAKAREVLVDALRENDPLAARNEARRIKTVAALAQDYLEKYAREHKKSWRKDESRLERHIVPAIGSLKTTGVTRKDVAALHLKITHEHGKYEANRTLELLSVMFRRADQWGYTVAKNPTDGVKRNREEKRDRWITPEELPRLAAAINAEQNLFARQALWLYLLTGLRKSELLSARWDDVDLNRGELRLPETKSGRHHYVPLSEEALAILRELPRIDGNPFVLPGAKSNSHLVNVDKPWRRVRKQAGVEDVRLHDLRRTVGSWLAQQGNSLHLIARVLNHKNTSTTAIYARFQQDHARQALETHGKKIRALAGLEPKGDVIPLHKVA